MVTFEEGKQEERLTKLRRKEEEDTVKMLAEKYHLPYADLAMVPINVDALALVREDDARQGELAVMQKTGRRLEIGVRNPEQPKTKDILEDLTRRRFALNLFLVSRASLEKAWIAYANVARRARVISGEVDVSPERLAEFRARVKTLPDIAT